MTTATLSPADRKRARQRARSLVEKFSWRQGKRGGRYWLPEGKPDVPGNRLYGRAAQAAASASHESARSEFRRADADLQSASPQDHPAALERYRAAESRLHAAQLANREAVLARARAAGQIPAVKPPSTPPPPPVHTQQIAAVTGAAKTATQAAAKGAKTLVRGSINLERRGGKAVSEILYGVTALADHIQAGVNTNFPTVARAIDWLATRRIKIPGTPIDVVPGDSIRAYHRLLSTASAAARGSGAISGALRVGANYYGYLSDEFRANKVRWGKWPARVIEIAAFITHKFLLKIGVGAAIGAAGGAIAGGPAGIVGGALYGGGIGLKAAIGSLALPEAVSSGLTLGASPATRFLSRKAVEGVAEKLIGPGKKTKEVKTVQNDAIARNPQLWERRKRHAAAKKARAARAANPFSLIPFSEQPEPLTVMKLVKAVRDRIGQPVSAGVILAGLATVLGDTPPQAGVEKFAWEDWRQVEGGKWRSPGGRVLSDAAYQKLKGRGRKKPAQTPAAKPTLAPAQPQKPQPTPANSAPASDALTRLGQLSNLAADTKAGRAVASAAARLEGSFRMTSPGQAKVNRLWTAAYRANKKRYGLVPAMAIEAVAWAAHHARNTVTPYLAAMGAGSGAMVAGSLIGSALGGPLGGALGLPIGATVGAMAAERALRWFQHERSPGPTPTIADRRRDMEQGLRPMVYKRAPVRKNSENASTAPDLIYAIKRQIQLGGGDPNAVPDAQLAAALDQVTAAMEQSLAA